MTWVLKAKLKKINSIQSDWSAAISIVFSKTCLNTWALMDQPQEVFCKKKVFLEISQKFTGKHLYQSLFLNKVAGLRSRFS